MPVAGEYVLRPATVASAGRPRWVIIPLLADAKSRGHAAASMYFGGKPPLALLGR